jgi:hypothetical protein
MLPFWLVMPPNKSRRDEPADIATPAIISEACSAFLLQLQNMSPLIFAPPRNNVTQISRQLLILSTNTAYATAP